MKNEKKKIKKNLQTGIKKASENIIAMLNTALTTDKIAHTQELGLLLNVFKQTRLSK